jgi:hypothetical protein
MLLISSIDEGSYSRSLEPAYVPEALLQLFDGLDAPAPKLEPGTSGENHMVSPLFTYGHSPGEVMLIQVLPTIALLRNPIISII